MDAPGQEVSQINKFAVPFILNVDQGAKYFYIQDYSPAFFYRSAIMSYMAWGMCVGDTAM